MYQPSVPFQPKHPDGKLRAVETVAPATGLPSWLVARPEMWILWFWSKKRRSANRSVLRL